VRSGGRCPPIHRLGPEGGRAGFQESATLAGENPLKPDDPKPPSNPDRGGPSPAEADAARVARARAGDREAFRALVEAHRDRIYGLCARMLRSPADAEEVAQDVFVRAWLALPRFRGESSVATWLHRIAVRRAIDRAETLRARRAREQARGGEAGDIAAPPGAGGAGQARRIEALVAALPAMQRAAVTMYYLEDRSVIEVARTLGLPENTVKTHLARARAALRRAWLASGGEERDGLS
jgi:RNA polymerase sigma-70 factor, ECF subfamily